MYDRQVCSGGPGGDSCGAAATHVACDEAKAEWFCCKAHTAGAGTRPGTRLMDVATWEFARRLDELNAWAYAKRVNAAAVPALRPWRPVETTCRGGAVAGEVKCSAPATHVALNAAGVEWFCCADHGQGSTRFLPIRMWELVTKMEELSLWACRNRVGLVTAAIADGAVVSMEHRSCGVAPMTEEDSFGANHLASALHAALVQLSEVQFIRSTPEASRRGSGNN